MKDSIPRCEHPRPDFKRKQWFCLNGEWQFAFGGEQAGLQIGYHTTTDLPHKIIVPFCYQSQASGIADSTHHGAVWYSRSFAVGQDELKNSILLKFGAVDYSCKLWINGLFVGEHVGGHIQFEFDITWFVSEGDNRLTVFVEDGLDTAQPRGKQYWKDEPDRCWYTATTGIWQSVWLEMVPAIHLRKLLITPNIDNCLVKTELFFNHRYTGKLQAEVFYNDELVKCVQLECDDNYICEHITIKEPDDIDDIHYWSPEAPNLYTLVLKLVSYGVVTDEIYSYFGMRKIERRGDMIYLNNRELYQRLVLDQGYWEESMLTPPSDEAIRNDILLTKSFGFNGARKHQKFEDPRYYYWADKLGLLVWGELPSGYRFHNDEMTKLTQEWYEFIQQSYNHPCIITWVPLNESWGVRNILTNPKQQLFAQSLYYTTKALDTTRLVSTNDGWETVEDTDLVGIHDYIADGEAFTARYHSWQEFLKHGTANKLPLAEGHSYKNQPILLTEYGGIAFQDSEKKNWGYNGAVETEEAFLLRLRGITDAIRSTGYIRGFCYTQLTDVYQETNGLLTMSRLSKIAPDKISTIIKG